jgi:hypothetical protein
MNSNNKYFTEIENGFIQCACGGKLHKSSKYSHIKTENHIVYLHTPIGGYFKYFIKFNRKRKAISEYKI